MIKIKQLSDDMIIPKRMEKGSSGVDLFSPVTLNLYYGDIQLIKLGFAIEIPYGFEWQIRPRSSMGMKKIIMPNAPGTIDSDYRGDVGVELMYLGDTNYLICRGDRIAQAVLCPINMDDDFQLVGNLSETERIGGFGSTGR
jgi:dUTP pyrophosphatase